MANISQLFKLYNSHGSFAESSKEIAEQLEEAWLRATRFWKRVLRGYSELTPVGVEVRGANVLTYQRCDKTVEIPEETLSRIKHFLEIRGIESQTLFKFAWALLLCKYCDSTEVVFGVEYDVDLGRDSRRVVSAPIRFSFQKSEAALDILSRFQIEEAERHENSFLGLKEIATLSEMSDSRSLFETLIAFDSNQDFKSNLPLTVMCSYPEPSTITFRYDANRIQAASIEGMAEHFKTILITLMASTQKTTVEGLSLMAREELKRILQEFNLSASTPMPTACVHTLFEMRLEAHRGNIAVVCDDQHITYEELNSRANQVAHQLLSLGVGPESFVAICLDKSIDMIVGLFGVLKSGGAYLPIDPSLPIDRIHFMLQETAAKVIISQTKFASTYSAANLPCIVMDVANPACDFPVSNPMIVTSPRHLAYTIYTSGSTGLPKGVLVEHASLANYVHCIADSLKFSANDKVLQFVPLSFDMSCTEIFPTLLSGGQLHLRTETISLVPDLFVDTLHRSALTLLVLPTSYWQQILPWLLKDFPRHLRLVGIGGSAVTRRAVQSWKQSAPPSCALWNGYGPTETTVATTFYPIDSESYEDREIVPIGKPIANTCVYILNKDQKPVPVGIEGELHIGGIQVARGYLNRPDLTAEKFIANPFVDEPGARVYRTGDLARWLADGNIEYLGRIDSQVKIRGFRIELQEIESRIIGIDGIQEAFVMARREGESEARLVAYFVSEDDKAVSSSMIRAALNASLPDYMIPSAFVLMKRLPLTSNGKVDTKSLPAPTYEEERAKFVPPRSEVEIMLCAIISNVLGIDAVGIHDSFFTLGGDSILLLQVVAKVRAHGFRISTRQVFERPTVAELSVVMDKRAPLGLVEGGITGSIPLSPIQKAFLNSRPQQPQHFNQSVLLEMTSELKIPTLEQSLSHLVRHHDALRMRFEFDPRTNLWTQFNRSETDANSLQTTLFDISMLDAIEAEKYIYRETQAAQARMDLVSGQLIQALVFDGGKSHQSKLFLSIQHFVVDGVSWRVLLEDLAQVYTQLEADSAAPIALPRKTNSFQAWSNTLYRWAQTEGLERELPYWKKIIEEPADLPQDSRGNAQVNLVASARHVVSILDKASTGSLLHKVPALYNTHAHEFLLTALVRTLRRWTGKDAVRIDLEGHGREDLFPEIDLSRTVGWFTSLFPAVFTLQNEDHADSITTVKEQFRAIPNRGLGFGVLRYLNPKGDVLDSKSSVCFNYLGQFDQNLSPGSGAFHYSKAQRTEQLGDMNPMFYPIEINAHIDNGALSIQWTYSSNNHTDATMGRLAASFVKDIQGLIDHCLSEGAGGNTASDFPESGLDQASYQTIVANHAQGDAKAFKHIYPLTPIQQGLYFHNELDPHSGDYLVQLAWTLGTDIDLEAFKSACDKLVEEQDILRSIFVARDLGEPLQIVYWKTALTWNELDWSRTSPADLAALEDAWLQKDRIVGFDFESVPPLRFTLIRLPSRNYRFIWSSHHILMDGWSLPLLIKKILSNYSGNTSAGREIGVEPKPFLDYVRWFRNQDMDKARTFWKGELVDFESLTPLPLTNRGADGSFQNKHEIFIQAMPATLAQSIKIFARKHQLTVNTITQVAWALLLGRYTGEEDIAFGSTVSLRPAELPGIESMIGPMINTLPVRVKIPLSRDKLEYLAAFQLAQAAREEYSFLALHEIQASSAVEAGRPLFNSIYGFENYPDNDFLLKLAPSMGDFRFEEQAHYPLSIIISLNEAITAKYSFDPQDIHLDAVKQIANHYQNILHSLLDENLHDIAQLELLSPSDLEHLLRGFNATERPDFELDLDLYVHQLVERQCQKTPDAIALSLDGMTMSYSQLNDRADRLAHYLNDHGVGPETIVAVCLERSFEMVISLFAILKAGAAYMPMDPENPTERIIYMLQDAESPILLTQVKFLARFNSIAIPSLAVDLGESFYAAMPATFMLGKANPQNLAYVIYTSGSSGRPKAAMNTHRSVVNRIKWMNEDYALAESDRILQKTPYTFDVSVWEFFSSLSTGATLVLARPEGHKDADYLYSLIRDQNITVLHFVPAMLNIFLDQDALGALLSIRMVVASGEALSPELVAKFFERLPHAQLHNLYGPTECAVDVSAWRCLPEHVQRTSIPIGRPVANTQLYILDKLNRPVPLGSCGELHIGGVQVGRGYLKREQLTDKAFIPDPFHRDRKARLYKTGDLARFLEDGTVEYLGRLDFQVKVRGFRIEPGEIESELLKISGIKDAIVVAESKAGTSARLVAYLIPSTPSGYDTAAIKKTLKAFLPDYMVPDVYIGLAQFPLNASGKIDRKALPAADTALDWEPIVAPRDALESMVIEIAAELLNLSMLGLNSNFFEKGGHSLLAMQLASRIRRRLAIELVVKDVFAHPILLDLCLYVRRLQKSAETGLATELKALETIPVLSRNSKLAASFAQERLWFLDALDNQRSRENSSVYLMSGELRLHGRLDAEKLQKALSNVVNRQESLRTSLVQADEDVILNIQAKDKNDFTIVDGLAMSENDRVALIRQHAERGFDPKASPLFRSTLLLLGEQEASLLITMHHIISDGWSLAVFARELSAFYTALCLGQAPKLSALPIQYADFAAWQRKRLARLTDELNYWSTKLEGIPPLSTFPLDKPRPHLQSFSGAGHAFQFSQEFSARILAFTQSQDLTPFMTLAGAFGILLHRYNLQDDIAIGTPVANRDRPEFEHLIGLFVNTLVLRLSCAADMRTSDFYRQVKTVCLEAYSHQEIPFEQLVGVINPDRSLSYSPLFQAMFSYDIPVEQEFILPELHVAVQKRLINRSRFDVSLSMLNEGGQIQGVFEYNTDLFEANTIEALANHYQCLLDGIITNVEQTISKIRLLSPDERRHRLEGLNRTAVPYPADEALHSRFERMAEQNPQQLALVFEGQTLSYGELNQSANRLARYLCDKGLTKGSVVAVCMNRGFEMVIALYAILKAGAAYLPIDPSYGRERRDFMVEDAEAKIVLTQSSLRLQSEFGDRQVICTDRDHALWAMQSTANLTSGSVPGDLAYIIYTSGSTGRPKGAMNAHQAVVNRIAWMQSAYALGSNDRVLQKTPFSFDVSVWEFFWPLAYGGVLVIAKPEGHKDSRYLSAVILQESISILHFVPSMLQAFLDDDSMPALPSIRQVMCSGEALPYELTERFFEAFPQVKLHNLYGPTECAVDVTAWTCTPSRTPVPIGFPIANCKIYILDPHGEPLPIGVAGELFIGGIQVGLGYKNRRELNLTTFLQDPFDPLGRVFRTGDLARYRPDGAIEYLGRLDFQIKLRGFRIEPGEIENKLLEIPNVREALVIARSDPGSDRRLVAYVSGIAVESEQLRSRLASQLPDFMVPSAFVVLPSLPLNANGKVDRRLLPAPDYGLQRLEFMAPRSAVEKTICGLLSKLLGRESISLRDRFFDIGGHSLTAMRLVNRIRLVLGVELPLDEVFAAADIAALASRVTAASKTSSDVPILSRKATLLASFAQERLWFLEQLERQGNSQASTTYLMAAAADLWGTLNKAILETALQKLFDRHESLRTAFSVEGDSLVLSIAEFYHPPLPINDLSALAPYERIRALDDLILAHASEGFELTQTPLCRIGLVALSDVHHVLVVNMHHAISDGWSVDIFIRELTILYASLIKGEDAVALPPLLWQYADYANWQRGQGQDQHLQSQLGYWRNRLEGLAPLLVLPLDRPRPAIQTYQGALHSFRLSPALAQSLKQFAKQQDSTLFAVLGAAFAALLSRYSLQNDIVFGTPVANRTRAEFDGVIGFFANTLVLRTQIEPELDFTALLKQFRTRSIEAFANQELPFERLVSALNPARSLAHSPLFQIMFTLMEDRDEPREFAGLEMTIREPSLIVSKFDLSLGFTDSRDALIGRVEFNRALFDPTTIERMGRHLENFLAAAIAGPKLPLADISLIDTAERQRVTVDFNRTAIEYPGGLCIHQMFEKQVSQRSKAKAVLFGDQSISYEELNVEANRLARGLLNKGVTPNSHVAVHMERGIPLIISIMAILKAGGTVVPIDASYPSDRVEYMLEDSEAKVLLTEIQLRTRLTISDSMVLCYDRDADNLEQESGRDLAIPIAMSSLAFIYYTSGSTGKPKGVMVPHRALANIANYSIYRYGLTAADRVLQFASISFDMAADDIFPTLGIGACIVMRRDSESLVPLDFLKWLSERGISKMSIATDYWSQMVSAALEESLPIPPRLRYIGVGGSAVSLEAVRSWQRWAGGQCSLLNAYGPTETTICASIFPFPQGWQSDRNLVPIGSPVSNTQIYILNDKLEVMPIGIEGEIHIGGIQVATGYWNRPDLTAEKFIVDPFAAETDARLYKTGDLGRWLADGTIEFLGRIDQQIKIRGFRVELGEVENCLTQCDGVRDALVIVHERNPGDKRLVAYIESETPAIGEWRKRLREYLPEYMVPAAFVVLQAFPLNHNGKVDRKALPKPDYSAPESTYAAPRNALEATLVKILSEVLRLSRVGIHDNFFELGGDSILLLQVVTKARHEGIAMTARQMFERQTVAELAHAVEIRTFVFDNAAIEGHVPTTPIQEIFFGNNLQKPQHFNQSVLLRLKASADLSLLEEALQSLRIHHDSLRMYYESKGGVQRQICAPAVRSLDPLLTLVELPHMDAATLSGAAAAFQAGLSLSEASLFRGVLFTARNADSRLFLYAHHLLVDGISWRILIEDLESAYRQLNDGKKTVTLPGKTTSFKKWAQRLQSQAFTADVRSELTYWQGIHAHHSFLPVDHLNRSNHNISANTDTVTLNFSAGLTQKLLQDLSREAQISEILLSALSIALCEWTGNSRVLIDVEGHGREDLYPDLDVSRTVGWFTSLYPLLLTRNAFPGSTLRATQQVLADLPNRGFHYGMLLCFSGEESVREWMRPEVAFNYLGQFDQTFAGGMSLLHLAEERLGHDASPVNQRPYLLEINGAVTEGQLALHWNYCRDIHNRQTIEALCRSFQTAIEAIVEYCLSEATRFERLLDSAKIGTAEREALMKRHAKDQDAISAVYPLTATQQGMIFHSVMEEGTYRTQMSWVMKGAFDRSSFEKAWAMLIARHDVLRTHFFYKDGMEPVQIVRKKADPHWLQLDWTDRYSADQERDLIDFGQAILKENLALDNDSLQNLALIRLKKDEWRFFWTSHHALFDGWSLAILMADFGAIYQSILQGSALELASVLPFGDYVRFLMKQDKALAEKFWRSELVGLIAPTALGLDRPRSAPREEAAVASVVHHLSQFAVEGLQHFIRKHHITMSTLMQGMWAILLARYSGDDNVAFGITVSGRPTGLVGVEAMVGLFINTVPAYLNVPADGNLVDWLQTLQLRQAEREEYSYFGLPDIQNLSSIPRGTPLFESIMVYENYPTGNALSASQALASDFQTREQTNYPLTIVIGQTAGLALNFTYRQSRFDAMSVQRLAGQFVNLLDGIVNAKVSTVSELPILNADEMQTVLRRFNERQRLPIQDKLVPELFEEQAARTPEAIALVLGEVSMSYRELNSRSNKLALRLRDQGVGLESRVALCFGRGVEMIIGMLATFKAGGAYVPIDPSYPDDRVQFMVEDSDAIVLVVDPRVINKVSAVKLKAKILFLEKDDGAGEDHPNLSVLAAPSSLAYVIYTSGSTGLPKGVMVEHGSLSDYIQTIARHHRLSGDDRVLQFTSFSFDQAGEEIHSALVSGAALYIRDSEDSLLPTHLLALMEKWGISKTFFPTAYWQQFAAVLKDTSSVLPKALRILVIGGSGAQAESVRAWYRQFGDRPALINGYGPTETTIAVTAHEIGREWPDQGIVPIGAPLGRSRFYILDSLGRPQPIGVAGELLVAGPQVARGYHNRPDLTAEKFIQEPFQDVQNARAYRTGDRARWLPDGRVEYMGRIDFQVKIRGFRVELGEIESSLVQLPGIREALVLTIDLGDGDLSVVAYVVEELSHKADWQAIRKGLEKKLPDFMIPSAMVIMETLPLNANGKVERNLLPRPGRAQAAIALIAPRNEVEARLVAIVAEIVKLPQVSIHDNFFRIGGHSLLAMKLLSRLQSEGMVLTLKELFATPVLADLALLIVKRGATLPLNPIARRDRSESLFIPASFAQERLWFIENLEGERGGVSAYHIPAALRLKGQLKVETLQQAFQALADRHESLRTSLVEIDGKVSQRILEAITVSLPCSDISRLPSLEKAKRIQESMQSSAGDRFDLQNSWLWRIELLRLAPDDHLLLFTMHHSISDGWSMAIVVKELTALYGDLHRGITSTLPVLPVQYADYAFWQRESSQEAARVEHIAYWQDQLKGLPPALALPLDNPRQTLQSFVGDHHSFTLHEALTQQIKAMGEREGTTLFMTLGAAFSALLGRYSQQLDFAIGTPIANRGRSELENIVGLFANTLVLRVRWEEAMSFRQFLQSFKEQCLGAYAHQELPFEQLVNAVNPPRSLSHSPLFQVMFALETEADEALKLPDLEIIPVQNGAKVARFDLSLFISEKNGCLEGVFEYNSDLFSPSTLERMALHFERLLDGAVSAGEQAIIDFPLSDAMERDLVVNGFNQTDKVFPSNLCIHQLFERQVARSPDAVALVFEGQEMSYRDLNSKSNQLAHFLREQGVRAESLVALCIERSFEMMIALFGILKAGGAYVPIDPNLPTERIRVVLRDAEVSMLLSRGAFIEGFQNVPCLTFDLEGDADRWANASTQNVLSEVSSKNLCYVIYTSGSTGRPKGAMNEHGAVVNKLQWNQSEVLHSLTPGDRLLQKTPFTFDVSVNEFFWPLSVGATLVLARPEGQKDARYIADAIVKERINRVHFVPSMLQAFLDDNLEGYDFRSLKQVMCSGEALSFDLSQRFFKRFPGVILHNLYGPTECAVEVTSHVCRPGVTRRQIPIGRPIANTRIYILDSKQRPVPIGVPGELNIAGIQVGRGYFNRPDMSSLSFIKNHFSSDPEARLYRSGDLARWLADGTIEYLGRLDQQVKIRGYRIELGEIEHAVLQCGGVREVVVTVREESPGDKRLIAYLVAETLDKGEIRKQLKSHLPDYMIPSAFVVLERIPLNSSGKVDRHALPAPLYESRVYVAPETQTERTLSDLIAEVVSSPTVGRFDNFFDIGGHSILAMQLLSRIRESFAIELALRTIFETADVAELATKIDQALAIEIDRAEAERKAIEDEIDNLTEEQLIALWKIKTGA